MKRLFIICLVLIAVFSMNAAFAESFTDLNEKISESDTITLNDDIILNQNTSNEENAFKEGISIIDRQIHIDANDHTIFANDSNLNQARLFNIANSNVTISNAIISSASFNGAGGAIFLNADSTLTLRNVTFRDCSALGLYGEGGAIYSQGTLFVYNCTFENNYASGAGGAIFSLARNSTISSSGFINNSAKWYGGAIHSCSNLFLDSSIFDSNSAYSGGAFHYAVSSLSLDYDNWGAVFNSAVFTDNKADFGGAISSASLRKMSVSDSCFANNQALKGGVMYKCGMTETYLCDCSIENNTAEIGAAFFDDSYECNFEDHISFIALNGCLLKDNIASDKASVFYGRSTNFWANSTEFYNNSNKEIINGMGNIAVMNSMISDYREDFITQFISGNITFINNTFSVNDVDFDKILDISSDTNLITDENYDGIIIVYDEIARNHIVDMMEGECCSVYVRLNSTDYTISQRRDGATENFTVYVDKTDDYIREFKAISEYFLLSKVYTNGWVMGCGGWDESSENEKVEALASDMALNGKIDEEALKLIIETKKISGAGHLLIVAPDGSYGNVVTYMGNDIFKMGVLNDGDYIISPNGADKWRQGHIDDISDVVEENIYLSANDDYGSKRHCILVHHVKLDDNGFSDDVYVSNEDGSFVNQTNYIYADSFWFKEEFTHFSEIPVVTDSKYLGTYYCFNKTIFCEDAAIQYDGDYAFKAKFINRDGGLLVNEAVQVIVNGKANEYVTNSEGIIEILFHKLTENQTITLTNPETGDTVESTIAVQSDNHSSNNPAEPKKQEKVSSYKTAENQALIFKSDKEGIQVKTISNNADKQNVPMELKIIITISSLKDLFGIFNLDTLISCFFKLSQILNWMGDGLYHSITVDFNLFWWHTVFQFSI